MNIVRGKKNNKYKDYDYKKMFSGFSGSEYTNPIETLYDKK